MRGAGHSKPGAPAMPHSLSLPPGGPTGRVFAATWAAVTLIFTAWWWLTDLDWGLWMVPLGASLAVYLAGLMVRRPPWWWWLPPITGVKALLGMAFSASAGPGLIDNGWRGTDIIWWAAFVVIAARTVTRSRIDVTDAVVLAAAAVATAHLVPSAIWYDQAHDWQVLWYHFAVGGLCAYGGARVLLSGWGGLQPVRWLAGAFALCAWHNFAAALHPDYGGRGAAALYMALSGLLSALIWHPGRWALDKALRTRTETTGRRRTLLVAAAAAVPLVDTFDTFLYESEMSAGLSLALLCAAVFGLVARSDITARAARAAEQRGRASAAEERELIARALHDSAVQHLAAARWALQGGDPARAESLIAKTSEELRTVIATLNTAVPETATQMDTALRAEQQLWPILWTNDIDERIFAHRTLTLIAYQVAREGVHNAGRHSRAQTGTIRITMRNLLMIVDVSDDGIGPPAGAQGIAPRDGHMGLWAVHCDVDTHGGVLELTRRQSGGALLRAVVPVPDPRRRRVRLMGGTASALRRDNPDRNSLAEEH